MTSDHIYIKIKIPTANQEHPASLILPNQDLKDMDVLYTFKIKMENQKSEHLCVKVQWTYPKQNQDAKPRQEPSTPNKARNHDLKDMDVLCTFKIKIESQNS